MTNKKLKTRRNFKKFLRASKRKNKQKMSLIQKLAYEFLPTSDESLLALDKEISEL